MDQSEENKVIIDGITYHGGLNQPRHFVKVNVDCWEKIFDLLSLRDILAMSQTCQRMRQIGGYYFRENFHGTVCKLHKFLGPYFRINDTSIELENCEFLRFIDSVSIYGQMENLEYYSDLLRSLTSLQFGPVSFNENRDFLELETVLKHIESVEFNQCYINGDSASQLLALCPKLKRLQFDAVDFEPIEGEHSLFQHIYPELVYFRYTDCDGMASLTSFLEQNPSIKYLRIEAANIWKIEYKNTSTIQLDCLNIKLDVMDIEPTEFANRLKTLYENGFYKKLYLSINSSADNLNLETFINEMESFKALEVLYTCPFHTNISHLIELKELHLCNPSDEIDLKRLAMNLTKLERLWIDGNVDHLLPFICYSNTIKVVIMQMDDSKHSENALNLFNLNQMRRMNEMRSKVLIGVFENIYLATKCKLKNVNCNSIGFTRAETILKYFEYKDMHLEI